MILWDVVDLFLKSSLFLEIQRFQQIQGKMLPRTPIRGSGFQRCHYVRAEMKEVSGVLMKSLVQRLVAIPPLLFCSWKRCDQLIPSLHTAYKKCLTVDLSTADYLQRVERSGLLSRESTLAWGGVVGSRCTSSNHIQCSQRKDRCW